jgi:hypothetical protein
VAQAPEHIDIVVVSGTHRYSERPEPSARKVLPLLVRTSTVEVDELPPAAEVPEDVDGAEPGAAPLLLQAAAKTPAAASGRPTLRASEALLEVSRLFICLPFRWNSGCRLDCLTHLNTALAQWRFAGCAMVSITRKWLGKEIRRSSKMSHQRQLNREQRWGRFR